MVTQHSQPGKTIRVRVLVLGEPTAGKSAVVECLSTGGGNATKVYNPTEGIKITSFVFSSQTGNVNLEFLLLDCSGMEIYQEFLKKALPLNCIPCFVVDVTNRRSFERLQKWIEFSKPYSDKTKQGILVANKCDLENRRIVPSSTVQDFAQQQKLKCFEISAKKPSGVREVFTELGENLATRITQDG